MDKKEVTFVDFVKGLLKAHNYDDLNIKKIVSWQEPKTLDYAHLKSKNTSVRSSCGRKEKI